MVLIFLYIFSLAERNDEEDITEINSDNVDNFIQDNIYIHNCNSD